MTKPALTLFSLLELFEQYEKHIGRRPVSVSVTQNQYDDLRLDPDTPRHLVFTSFGDVASIAGVRIDIDNRVVGAELKPVHPLREPRPCGANLRA